MLLKDFIPDHVLRRGALFTSTLLAVVARTPDWTPSIGLIMLACNVVAILIARATVKYPNVGPGIPVLSDVAGLSLPALLGATSLGHILGAGVILGLTNTGTL
ncbi:MAG: photosystem I reaction center subunit PsaK [Leptolyngbya sp. IPPAS B-1204]